MAGHFRQLSNLGRTELRIGSSMFFCTYVLPDLMKEFQLLYPQVTLTLTEGGILSGSGGAGDHLPALRNSVTCDRDRQSGLLPAGRSPGIAQRLPLLCPAKYKPGAAESD